VLVKAVLQPAIALCTATVLTVSLTRFGRVGVVWIFWPSLVTGSTSSSVELCIKLVVFCNDGVLSLFVFVFMFADGEALSPHLLAH
jgi:hypothetical protein